MKQITTIIRKYALLILLIIVLFGGVLRFTDLSSNPPALNWDEVAFGYNAYSLLQTGKDEYGSFLPGYLRSLDDYKRPVYTYATVMSVAVFGLTDFAVRFPSALFGTMTILLVYLLSLEFFRKKSLALTAAFLLAVTPWHIQFSRAGFEATLGFFFTGLGVLCSLWGIRKNAWWYPVAALSFGLAMYSYLGQRVAVPILMLTLAAVYGKTVYLSVRRGKGRLAIGIAAAIVLFFAFSLARDSMAPEGNIRYKATSIFAHTNEYEKSFQRMQSDAEKRSNIPRRIFHDNRLFVSLELVARGYLTHFSPDFFFFDLGQQHHHAPGIGLLYIWMLPFLLIGGYQLVKQPREVSIVLAAWIFGPPVAASVTYQIPHALRVGDMIIPIIILIAYGVVTFFSWLHSTRRYLVLPIGGVLALVGILYFVYFVHQYTMHLPEERSEDWVYGRKEAVLFAEAVKSEYDKVIVSTSLDYPYIFFLYYAKHDPEQYQKEGGTRSGGFAEEKNAFGKYEFHRFDYSKDRKEGTYLFIGKPDEFPSEVTPLKIIPYLNGQEAIYIVESGK